MKRTPTCTICGQPAPRGARLCAPCRAALKRAGQCTVQDLPHYRDPVPRRYPRMQRVTGGGHAATDPPHRGRRRTGDRWRRTVLVTAAVAALAGVAYLGQPQWDSDDDRAPGDAGPVRVQRDAAAGHPAAAVVPPRPAQAAAVPPLPAPAVAAIPSAPAPARAAVRPPPPAASAAAAPPAPVEPPTAAVAYPSLDAFGVIAEAPRAPPPPVQAARPAPPPDRWQRMRDALAQCEREGGFAGFLCDQRTRIDACNGYWGRVPQCPDMPENPR